ncbi:MAG: PilZ domain-containing protein [Desulfobulbus sp.]|jgi:hypothetical protein
METQALTIAPDKRKNMRVPCDRWFYFSSDNQPLGCFGAVNASQTGLFLRGTFLAEEGDICSLELHKKDRGASALLRVQGRVSRKEPHGVAVRFTHMEEHSFMLLQTMLLYASDDPMRVAEQLEECFSC